MEKFVLTKSELIELVQEVIVVLRPRSTQKKWISEKEVMAILGVTSKTTIQRLRDEGRIVYSQPMKRVIIYDRDSIIQLIKSHIKEKF
jgi:Helix-turn-helix domain